MYKEVKTNDRVRIMGGRYQGKTGKVTSIALDVCVLKLDGNLEEVKVVTSDCEAIDDKK
jgi:ribosomal protein L24